MKVVVRMAGCAVLALASGCLMPNPDYNGVGETDTDGVGGSATSGLSSTGGSNGSSDSAQTQGNSGQGTSTTAADSSNASSSMSAGQTSSGSDSTAGDSTGEDEVRDCPDDPALRICLDFDVADVADVADGSSYGNAVAVEGGGMVGSPWGSAMRYDESTSVEVDCMGACAGGPTMTYEAWVRADEFPDDASRAGILDNQGVLGMFLTTDRSLRCVSSAGTVEGGSIPRGEWVHVACVADETSLRAYVAGVSVSDATISALSPADPADPLAVGNNAPQYDNPFLGDLDRVRAWDRALTREEVEALASG